MTDLEMTRLCAEAMGIATEESFGVLAAYYREGVGLVQEIYEPISNDAQSMALLKKFHVALGWNDPGWGAFRQDIKRWVNNDDLNRAIVECVADMQRTKSAQPTSESTDSV